MATDQEFRDLEAVVATLRRDLRESQDTINLWRQNGLGHLDSGSGKWRFGGNVMQLDNNGIQIESPDGSNVIGVFFVNDLMPDPENHAPRGTLYGKGDDSLGEAYAAINALAAGSAYQGTAYTSAGTGDGSAVIQAGDSAGRFAGVTTYVDGTVAAVGIYGQQRWGLAFGTNPSILTPSTITADADDYSPTGWTDAGFALRLSTDASRNVTGIAGGTGGRAGIIFNVGSFDIVLKDEDAGSDAANRFALNGDITLAPDTGAILWYDATSSRWRCAGRYSAGGGAGDVATDTLWDALGDLAVGTGANTANNLPVGTDGYVLTADSTDLSFGIKWAPAAGGPGGSTSIARTLMLMGA